MCLYQTDPRWHRHGAVDERPRDVAPAEPDGLVVARRPLRERAMGAMCAAYGRMRRLAARLGGSSPAASGRPRPGLQ